MAEMKSGRRQRIGFKDLGLRRYKKHPSGAHAFALEIKGKRHYLRLDRAIADYYGWVWVRSELKNFLRSFGIKPASVMK